MFNSPCKWGSKGIDIDIHLDILLGVWISSLQIEMICSKHTLADSCNANLIVFTTKGGIRGLRLLQDYIKDR